MERKTRDERQAENIEKWKKVECRGTLEGCTGYGKTRTAIKAFERMQNAYGINALVVVPTTYLVEQWQEKFKEFNLSGIKVRTIQGMLREYDGNPVEDVTLLIPDEIHKYTATEFGKLYDIVNYRYVLGLTATVPEGEKMDVINNHAPVFDTVTLSEALDNKWVSPFIIYQLGVTLPADEKSEYDSITDTFYKCFSWFNHDFNLVKACSDDRVLRDHIKKVIPKWQSVDENIGRFKGYIARFWGSIQKRKKLLSGSVAKLEAVNQILNRFDDKLTICFSQRTDFADQVGDLYPERSVVYHSNINGREIDDEYYGVDRLKERAIKLFSDPDSAVNVLSTAKALDMGADIPAVDLGIITSGTSKSLQAIQRTGRIIRKQEGKRSIIVDIFAKDTQDEKWMNKRYNSFSSDNIRRIYSTKDITEV